MDFLTTDNLSVGYSHRGHDNVVLQDLNLNLKRGSLVSLLGANGAGKSTLLRTLTAVQRPICGNVFLNGNPITDLSQKDRSKLIGIVTTDQILAGALTVTELVALGRQPHTGFLGRLSHDDINIVHQAMADAGIAHKADCFVAQLSDGERQKAMIAKSLAQSTPLIILDEPTAFLDVASRIETMKLLHALAHKHNKAVLLSSHDISQSLLLADELWVITSDGTMHTGGTEDLILQGALNDMFQSSALQFNKALGDFVTILPTSSSVDLVCTDAALHRCIANALMRNGIGITTGASRIINAEISDGSPSLSYNGKSFTSVSQLLNAVKMA